MTGLVVAGVVLGWRILGGVEALVATGYGQLMPIRSAVVTGAAGVAAWNRYVLLPRLLACPDPEARAALRPALRAAGAFLLFVLVLTGVLTSLSP